MEPINIAIIGAVGVGKSTFIQHLRRQPRPSASNITALRHELDGASYLVTLVELDLEGIELDPNQPVHWPKQIGGHSVPRMDGALILYDAVNEGSMREVPPIMGESQSRTDALSDTCSLAQRPWRIPPYRPSSSPQNVTPPTTYAIPICLGSHPPSRRAPVILGPRPTRQPPPGNAYRPC
jgi:hypothetical protein